MLNDTIVALGTKDTIWNSRTPLWFAVFANAFYNCLAIICRLTPHALHDILLVSQLSVFVTKYPRPSTYKSKGFFWITVLEISVHSEFSLPLGHGKGAPCSGAEQKATVAPSCGLSLSHFRVFETHSRPKGSICISKIAEKQAPGLTIIVICWAVKPISTICTVQAPHRPSVVFRNLMVT